MKKITMEQPHIDPDTPLLPGRYVEEVPLTAGKHTLDYSFDVEVPAGKTYRVTIQSTVNDVTK